MYCQYLSILVERIKDHLTKEEQYGQDVMETIGREDQEF